MLTAAVIHLQAIEDSTLATATGRGMHGFWFRHWKRVDPGLADQLHAGSQTPPYTLSPLMGLPRPTRNGAVKISQGTEAWFRATSLTADLSEALQEKWLPGLDSLSAVEIPQKKIKGEVEIPGVRWQVTGVSISPEEHPWAGQTSYQQLSHEHLMDTRPPVRWRLRFSTPTAFHGTAGHLPFPLPDSLSASWLRRWNSFAPVGLPEALPEIVRERVVVSAYNLKTVPVREGQRLTLGCVGGLSLRALKMHPSERAVLDTLAAYAFYAGSGHRTTQGMGVTRRV